MAFQAFDIISNVPISKDLLMDRQHRLESILRQNASILNEENDFSDFSRIGSGSDGMSKRNAVLCTVGLAAGIVALGYIILKRPNVSGKVKTAWVAAASSVIKIYESLTGKSTEGSGGIPNDHTQPTRRIDTTSRGLFDWWASSGPSPEQIWYLQSAIGLALVLYGLYELYQTWNLETELAELEQGVGEVQEKIASLTNDRIACEAALDDLQDACDANSNPSFDAEAKTDFLALMERMMCSLRTYRRHIREVRSWLQKNIIEYEKEARRVAHEANNRSIRTGVLAVAATVCAAVFQPGLPLILAAGAGGAGMVGAFWSSHQVRRAREVVVNLEKCEEDLEKHRVSYNKLTATFRQLSRSEDLSQKTRQDVELMNKDDEIARLRAELANAQGRRK